MAHTPEHRKQQKEKLERERKAKISAEVTASQQPKRSVGGLSDADRLELAQARAGAGGIPQGSSRAPIISGGDLTSRREISKQAITGQGERLGLLPGEIPQQEGIEITSEPIEEDLQQAVADVESGKILKQPNESTGEFLIRLLQGRRSGGLEEGTLVGGAVPIGLPVPQGFTVGGRTLFAGKAAKAGTAAKNTAASKGTLLFIKKNLAGVGLAVLAGEKIVSFLGDRLFNRGIDEAQQGLNTLGQVTSSIVGDSTSGAGDVDKGLKELIFIRQEILKLEEEIQAGKIRDITLRANGKIIDINADIFDQLATVDEGIRDLRTFIISGQQPELTEFEIQSLLRELEEEGHIKPVDLTTARRQTSGLVAGNI